ncbi:MAG: hypothetical protein Q9174_002808 [Haloplaca sp. 1 TL-2023]
MATLGHDASNNVSFASLLWTLIALAPVIIALAAIRKTTPPRKASLENLPVELLLRIQDFLPQSGAIALSHTSQKFHQLPSKVLTEDLFDRFPSASESPERMADQTVYRGLLTRDKINPPRAAYYRWLRRQLYDMVTTMIRSEGCRKLAVLLNLSERGGFPRGEGLLYTCPSRIISFDEAATLSREYARNRPLNRPGGHEKVNGLCGCKQHFTTILELGNDEAAHLYQAFPLFLPRKTPRPLEILNTLRVRICPHTSISDVRVQKSFKACLYDRGADLLHDQRKEDPMHRCKKCLTKFHFLYHNIGAPRRTLFLLVGIPLDKKLLSRCDFRHWYELMTLPSEVKRRNEEWQCFERLSQTPQAPQAPALVDPSDRESMLSRNIFELV